MSSPTVYFVTGANRGIGLALITHLVNAATNVYIFAAVRRTSAALDELVAAYPDKLSVVSFVAADESSNKAAAKIVGDKFGRVDTVLGVAGMINFAGKVEETPQAEMMDHYRVNLVGNVVLFQAFAGLLRKSKNPKFIPFTSLAGSLTAYINTPIGFCCYGSTKAALNYVARRIHYENEWITCFPLSPGLVVTDMATSGADLDKTGTLWNMIGEIGNPPDVAAAMLVKVIEDATRDTYGGELMDYDGTKATW